MTLLALPLVGATGIEPVTSAVTDYRGVVGEIPPIRLRRGPVRASGDNRKTAAGSSRPSSSGCRDGEIGEASLPRTLRIDARQGSERTPEGV